MDMCFQMQRAKEFYDWKDPNDSFSLLYSDISDIGKIKDIEEAKYGIYEFNPDEWCPIGTIEFVEKYLVTYFPNCAGTAMRPLNVPDCFLDNKMNTGRKVINVLLSDVTSNDSSNNENSPIYYIKDNAHIKSPLNGRKTIEQACADGLIDFQASSIIKDGHNASEWRCFIHNGEVVDVKHYMGDPFAFPDMDTVINSYMYQLGDTLREGTLDVYVDPYDQETYVMECHRFFSCGLYGFDHPDILPLMYWRTFLSLIK